MAEQVFRPGESVPESGVYLVEHKEHRRSHEATLLNGADFPRCAGCGEEVRFRLVRAASPLRSDQDFQG